ncbi:Response regulator receiver modulated CheW protein [Candidatus Magnetomorum sp. HK-1]|nr:Response regulator receiver modulated CheW protein [Candidatus Magnetomorum sp. HK-1]
MGDSNLKILLVDDFKSTRNLERNMLKAIGYNNIVEAVDGEDAINKLLIEHDIGLIISDWNMPNKSGYDLLVWVRANGPFKSLPFVMATAQSEKKEMIKALKAGATSYIPKPFNKDELEAMIDKVMDSKQESASDTTEKKVAPVKTSSGKLILNVAHIQITDHLALGVLKHLITTGEFKPKYFELNTKCMGGWNPVSQSLENGEVDAAFVLAPIAMDLFKYDAPIKLILFAHRDGSICVGNNSDKRIIDSARSLKNFYTNKTFYLPHLLSIHHMLSDMFLKELGLTPGVAGNPNVDVFFEIVPPVQMPVFMSKDEKIGGFLVAEPIGTNAITKKIAKPMFVSSEIWTGHPCCVVAMRENIINEYPDAVYEFTNMLVQAGQYISNNKDQSAEIGVNFLDPQKKLGLSSKVLKKVLIDPKGIKTDNLFPVLEDIDQIQRYMCNIMKVGSIIDLEKFVDTKFAEDACKNQSTQSLSKNHDISDVIANIVGFYMDTAKQAFAPSTPEFNKKAYEKELSEKFFSKGVQLLKGGKTFEALESLFAAFALDQTNMKAVNNIVVAYKYLGSTDFALKTVERVLEIDPNNLRAKDHKKILLASGKLK